MARRKKDDPHRLGSILDEFFSKRGWKPTISRHRIVQMWPDIVEERVARHAQVEHISGSVLHVVVDSAVWMNELSALKTVLLEKVNAKLGRGASPFTDIRFSQRSWAGRPQTPPPAKPDPVPSPTEEELAQIRDALEPVEDEELRAMLARIIEKQRQLQHRRQDKDR